MNPPKENYMIQLDALRCFAVLSVTFGHLLQWNISNAIISSLPSGHGVTLFFVLSGFLITNILLKYRQNAEVNDAGIARAFKIFYARRTIRIFPIYYLTVMICFALNFEITRKLFPWLLTYTSNIYQAINKQFVGSYNHFWSLAVEEQFYVIWPCIIFLIPFRRIKEVIVFIIILSLLFRFLFLELHFNWMYIHYSVFGCMNTLGLGALLAYYKNYGRDTFDRIVRLKHVVMPLLLLYWGWWAYIKSNNFTFAQAVFDEFAFALICFVIIAKASVRHFNGKAIKILLENRIVIYTGKISYGMYIYHLFIDDIYWSLSSYIGLNSQNKYFQFCMMLIFLYVLATLSWFLIEKPLLKLKKHFE